MRSVLQLVADQSILAPGIGLICSTPAIIKPGL
jgi:hypothetical protein